MVSEAVGSLAVVVAARSWWMACLARTDRPSSCHRPTGIYGAVVILGTARGGCTGQAVGHRSRTPRVTRLGPVAVIS